MTAIFLVFLASAVYLGFKIPRKINLIKEKRKEQEELIRAKIRAENFKKKIKLTKRTK
jgi:hypothetical protein